MIKSNEINKNKEAEEKLKVKVLMNIPGKRGEKQKRKT